MGSGLKEMFSHHCRSCGTADCPLSLYVYCVVLCVLFKMCHETFSVVIGFLLKKPDMTTHLLIEKKQLCFVSSLILGFEIAAHFKEKNSGVFTLLC